ncbi:hypothetical protein [Streptomyces sp. B1I3]|uniref:hypothetical protein n=1 Tax=Streptomyces sp. B1I3 TaxID=3042264 RepID=UPI00278AF767|nr:hypothetical protein [Streptomyces sp. B1I3]MDQ0791954.1 hypothetical protein [Streptomyces sp. B1I3]
MPITDAYGQGITSLDYGETPDLKVMGESLLKIVGLGVMKFASATARTAAIAAPVEGMTVWLQDVNRLEVYNGTTWAPPPSTLTTTAAGASAASGFSIVSFSGRSTSAGVYMVNLTITRTGSQIDAGSAGNIADTVMATLPVGWRPPEQIPVLVDDGFGSGGAIIDTAGLVTLRTWSPTGSIIATRQLKLAAVYI